MKTSSTLTRRPGFTLLELMVVLLILALLASLAAPQVMKHLSKAKSQTAKIQIDALSASIHYFQIDVGRIPSEAEGLQALLTAPSGERKWDGPYVEKKDSIIDPWGHPYHYKQPGQHGDFDLFTLGSDNQEGGDGEARDIGNW